MKNYSLYLELLSLRPKEYCELLVAYATYAKLSADLIKSNFLEAVPSTMVQLIKNGKKISAFVPGYNAIKMINEHDEVVIDCIGGKMGRAKGDIPCVRWQIIKVNDQSLNALLSGKIEKGRR